MNLRISDFCHLVDGKNDVVAVYNALTLGVVVVDRETANLFRNASYKVIPSERLESMKAKDGENLLKELVRHKLVFPLGQRPDLEDYRNIQAGLECKRIGLLYLLMTDTCNLGCKYCFLENAIPDGYEFSEMSEEIARKGIDLFVKSLRKSEGVIEPQIILYGGEPFLNTTVVSKVLDYIRELKRNGSLPVNTLIIINTNGTLINSEVISLLNRVENVNIAISLDGFKNSHDSSRKYLNGEGTYDDIVRGYQLLVSNNIEVGFCCTISKYNIDKLEEIARWFVDEFGVRSIGFNIMIENTHASEVRGDVVEYAKKAARKIIECFRFFRENGVYEDRIMRKVNAFVDGCVYYYDCGGCGQQLVVSPNGMVGVCQGYCGTRKYFIVPDESFDPFNHPIWGLWRYRSPLFMAQCKDCIAISVCGGGCPYSADMRHGSIWELDDIFCIHAKTTVEFLLQDLMEKVQLF